MEHGRKKTAAAVLDCIPLSTFVVFSGATSWGAGDVVAARQHLAGRDLLGADVVRVEFFWAAWFVWIQIATPSAIDGASAPATARRA